MKKMKLILLSASMVLLAACGAQVLAEEPPPPEAVEEVAPAVEEPAPVVEAPVEEAVVEEAPVEEAVVEEAPVEEVIEEAPAARVAEVETQGVAVNEGVCPQYTTGHLSANNQGSWTYTAPEGFYIVKLCVKAGSANQGDGPEEVTVPAGATSITFTHSTDKNISHFSVLLAKKTFTYVPPTYPGIQFSGCTEYKLEKSTSTWDADTGTWSAWTDWPGTGPLAWGEIPDDLTGHHGGTHGEDGDRHFAYVIVDQRPITTGECAPPPVEADPEVTIYTECGFYRITLENDIIVPEGYTGEDATFVVTIDGVETEYVVVPGAVSIIAAEVEEDSGDVEISVQIVGGGEPYEATVDSDCEQEPVEVTPFALYTPPTCDSVGTLEFPESPNYTVIDNEDGTYTFVANEGSVFPEGTETTVGPFELAQLIGEACATTTLPPPPPPPGGSTTTTTVPGATTTTTVPGATTTAPPITGPATVVTTTPPPPPTASVTPPPPAGPLPSTGASIAETVAMAAAALAVGGGLIGLTRRRRTL